MVSRLRWLISTNAAEPENRRAVWPWMLAVFGYAAGCALLALRRAFASEFTLADDVREHVFWMFRFINPRLFPQDAMADYFQSLAPPGFAGLYWLLSRARIDPLLASKLIPPVLSLIAAAFFFGFARRFFRSAATAAFTTVVFIQVLWSNSDLASATPRAFFYPLFAAFLFFRETRSITGLLVTISLAALIFPPCALLCVGVLGFACLRWSNRPRLVPLRSWEMVSFAAASALTLLGLASYFLQAHALGPLVTYAQAKGMAEFTPKGRVPVFFSSWWGYWVGGNAGVHELPTRPPWFLAAFLWPLLRRFPDRFPLLKSIPRGAPPVPLILASSLSLFLLAHLLLFQLYLPSRYTAPVERFVLILLGGGALLALLDGALLWSEKLRARSRRSGLALAGVFCALLVLGYPLLWPGFPTVGYIRGADPALYEFFARQPISSRIATLSDEGDNIPTFSRRSVAINAECAVPFHPAYYLPLRDRGLQIARAQYSSNPDLVEQCVREQQIDFWLLDAHAFRRKYWPTSRLLRQLRLSSPGENLGVAGAAAPFLQRASREAIVFQDGRFVVLDTHRLFPVPRQIR